MLNNKDANGPVSGRNSRASNMSGASRATSKQPGDLYTAPPGIQSMLRTSTEMGNVVGYGGDLSGFNAAPLHSQRRGASSRLSTTSSVSNHSNYTHHRQHRHYPSSSSAARQSVPREQLLPLPNVPQYMPDTLSPTMLNLPGSSPMVPMRQRERDSQRSLSITHSVRQPDFRLSNSNRSMGSLRGHDVLQRSNSPYVYPHRIGPPGYRAASPAWSDMPGQNPRRLQAQGGRGHAYPPGHYVPASHPSGSYHPGSYPQATNPPGQMRRRVPSDASLANSERSQPPARRHPSRGPSPVYYQRPYGDDNVPPMPSLHHHFHPAVEQARRANNNSIMGSASSGSMNMRTDSDTPSSDLPQPPTPRDGMSVGHPYHRTRIGATAHMTREDVSSGPLYYDGSEQFETDSYTNPETERMPTGFVDPVKKHISCITPPRFKSNPSSRKSLDTKRTRAPDVAELPGSPVARPITRELIKKGLEPVSTTGDLGSPNNSSAPQGEGIPGSQIRDQPTNNAVEDEMTGSSELPITSNDNRHSVMSQVGSSFLESTTMDLARDTYLPALTGTGLTNGTANKSKSSSAPPGSPEKSTDDGMSELLAGYQHTDSKPQVEVGTDAEAITDSHPKLKSDHVKTSSDDQSFKSCTDVPEPVASDSASRKGEQQHKTVATGTDSKPFFAKDTDARSFQTDVTTPGPASSRAPSRLPSTSLATLEVRNATPATDMPSTSPLRTIMRKAVPRDSGLTHVANKLRGNSRPSIKQGSVSISGSSSTLSVAQQPIVPPRESSASKEAQRSNAVSAFLMRFRRPKSTATGDGVSTRDSVEHSINEPVHPGEETDEPARSVQQPRDVLKTPEKAVAAAEPDQRQRHPTPPVDSSKPSEQLRVGMTMVPNLHHRAFSMSPAGAPMPSSVYSPQDLSHLIRTQSSPAGLAVSPESTRRDSQSTTHLSWISRKPMGISSASASEPHLPLPSVQEDTTTDLRYSGCRYNYPPQRYLPDLKEESHEDSSLNTSASNLKGSHFRFPFGGGPGMRTSADEGLFLSRRSSTRSHRRSVVWEAQGLPCMEFSQANLFEKFKDALGDARFSRSLELPDVEKSSPQRSVSTGDLREDVSPVISVGAFEKAGQPAQTTGVIDFAQLRRSYPPELMAEIDRLSIPSVTQLTQRFTEMLPSLSLGDEYRQREPGEPPEFPEEEELMEHALESIHEVHPPSQKRSSARLRPMRGSSALMVVDDDVFEELTSRAMGGPGANAGGEVEGPAARVGEVAMRTQGENNDGPNIPTRKLSPIAELQPPSPAVLRPRSNTTAGLQPQRSSAESALSARRSLRSLVSTPTATVTRPWNFDEYYPWATTTHPSVNITLPPPSATRNSPRAGPSHLRNALSDATTSTFTSARTTTASPTGNATGLKRQSHRLSIFGSSSDQAHAVGERYPTSALSPPTAIFRDNLSTCDTSDDEDFTTSRKTRLSLRKRFSSAARNNTLILTPPRVTRSKTNPADLASPASDNENSSATLQDRFGEARAFTNSHRHTYRDAQGMPTSTYRRQRLVESIKRWYHKGAELIRTFSRRN